MAEVGGTTEPWLCKGDDIVSDLQIFGEATVENGGFTDAKTTFLVDAGGAGQKRVLGTTHGLLADGTTTKALIGTILANDKASGFAVRGGYVATRFKE